MKNTMQKNCLGIDVSKETLDIYWQGRFYKIMNQEEALTTFIEKELSFEHPLLCVMESTGGYERLAAKVLMSHNLAVHIVHPTRIHAFAKVSGHFAKTDKLDAKLLFQYAEFISDREEGKSKIDSTHDDILALRRLAQSLEKSLHAAQCRSQQMPEICDSFLKEEITFYQKKLSEIQRKIEETIDRDPSLRSKQALMMSMTGIGKKIASVLLAELPELGTVSKRKIAALIGLAPKTQQSGKKSSFAHIFGGRFYARKALYMGALVATRYEVRAMNRYQHLQSKGKSKKVALVAIMRDMIVSLNAMLKKEQLYSFNA